MSKRQTKDSKMLKKEQLAAFREELNKVNSTNQFADTIALTDKALPLARELRDAESLASILRIRALALLNVGRKLEATQILTEAEDIATKHTLEFELGKVYRIIGAVHLANGNDSKALELYQKSYAIIRRFNDVDSIANLLHDIGTCYSKMQRFDEAVEVLKECLALKENYSDEWDVATTLHSLGLAYYYAEKHELALEYTLKALAIKERFPERDHSISYTHHSLASIYYYLGDYEKAHTYVKKSMVIKQKYKDTDSLSRSMMVLAALYHKSGNTEEAIRLSLETLHFNEEHSINFNNHNLHEHLAEYYESIGEYQQAIVHLRKEKEVSKAFASEVAQRRFEEYSAELQLEMAQYKAQVESLKAQQLQVQVEAKDRELAAQALNLARKNEMLQKLYKHIESSRSKEMNDTQTLDSVERFILSSLRSDNAWKNFEEQFSSTHHGFMATILARYPTLATMEIRLCSLLVLNLSTKEIAHILSITPKSVEVYRTRLRKKLAVPGKESLIAFLSALQEKH